MDKDEVAKYLQLFIRKNELTQEEFARLISAPLSSVSSWIHGKRTMSKIWQQVLKSKRILPADDEQIERQYEREDL